MSEVATEVRLCRCGCGGATPDAKRAYVNQSHYVEHLKCEAAAREEKRQAQRRPCICGCGKMATPGARFILGHGRKGKTKPRESFDSYERNRKLAIPVVSVCGHCGWRLEGTVDETAIAFREHPCGGQISPLVT